MQLKPAKRTILNQRLLSEENNEAYCHWSIVRTRSIRGFSTPLSSGEMQYLACYCFSNHRTFFIRHSDNNSNLPKRGYVMRC